MALIDSNKLEAHPVAMYGDKLISMQLPGVSQVLGSSDPSAERTQLQYYRSRGKRRKVDLHHQAVGSIGLHRYGAHVLRKGQTTFFEQASKLFPRVPTALDPRRHALFTGQIRGGESKSPLFNLFYSVQVNGPRTGLSLRSRGSCSHEASPFGCGTLLFILPEEAFAGPTAPQRLGMAEPPSSATLTIQADKY